MNACVYSTTCFSSVNRRLRRTALGAALLSLLLIAASASAVTNAWTGAGADNNWSTAGNWTTGVPLSGDVALFDGTSSKDCTIDQTVTVTGFHVKTGYAGTISQGASVMTVGAQDFIMDAGTFAGGSAAITLNGSFVQSGGDFTSTSGRLRINGISTVTRSFNRNGGTFLHNNGEVCITPTANSPTPHVTITAGGCVFYDFTIDYATSAGTNGDVKPMDDFTVAHALRITGNRTSSYGSRFNPGTAVTVTLQGDLIKQDGNNIALGNANVSFLMTGSGQTVYCGQGGIGGKVTFQGSGTDTITNYSLTAWDHSEIYNVTVDKADGQVVFATDAVARRLQVQAGNTVDAGGYAIWPIITEVTTGGGNFLRNYGTILNADAPMNLTIASSSSFYLYSGTHEWSSVILHTPLSTGSGVTLEDSITINGNLRVEGSIWPGTAFLNTGNFTISVGGDFYFETAAAGKFADATDTLRLNGSGTQTVTVVNGTFRPKLVVAGGAKVALGNALSYSGASATVEAGGTLNLDGYNFSASSLIVAGTLRRRGGETVTVPTLNAGSTVWYDGDSTPITVTNWPYKILFISAPGKQLNWTASQTYTISEGFVAAHQDGTNSILRSTVPGSTWSINTAGATQSVWNVDVQDSTALGPQIAAWDSVDANNNVNWAFLSRGTCVTFR